MSAAVGIDVGTANLVVAKRNDKNEIEYRQEINAFVELPLDNRFMFNMLKKNGVRLIEKEKSAFLIGKQAEDLAFKYVYPEDYKWITKIIPREYKAKEKYLKEIK